MKLTPEIAGRFARIALGHVRMEFPNKLDHVMTGEADITGPRAQHPIFYGSYDWHSCVHSYWMLLTVRRLFPELPEVTEITALADEMFSLEKVAGELDYLARPTSAGFERPYGWAWLLALHGEAARHDAPWAMAIYPLAEAFAERFKGFFPKQTYPIRTGTHFNSAFAFILALEWADVHDSALASLIRERARSYYGNDRDCPAWEPGGDEFLSSAMVEALCMKRVLPDAEFAAWFAAFLPRLDREQPQTLFTPALVTDRSDGKLAHLDGFNFTRAWCWRGLSPIVGEIAIAAADRHLAASITHIEDDYMGSHWLCSFVLLALGTETDR